MGEHLQFITFISFDTMAPSALSDVCLKENMTLADRLYNLQLIQEFCRENLSSCCHFSLEDMLYASSTIKVLNLSCRVQTIKSYPELNIACSHTCDVCIHMQDRSWLAACTVQLVPCGRSTEQMAKTGVTVRTSCFILFQHRNVMAITR